MRYAGGVAGLMDRRSGRLWDACSVPWAPELFSAPALQRILDKYRRERLRSVPFFDGLMSGEIDALVESFSGVPEVHHPVRGRIKGESAFRRFVTDTTSWLAERNVDVEHVNFVTTDPRRVEEVVLHLDGDGGRIGLPFAIACDHDEENERIIELRLYFSTWPLTGRHANRPPLLQPDLDLYEPDVVGAYQRALATGDVEAILAAFEPDGYTREPAGDGYVHRGTDELRALYELFLSNGGASRLSTAPSPTTAAPARWSTTWSPGAGRRCRPKPASPSMSVATAASSPPRASTTTPNRR
jgi:hypothetical protein